MSLYPRGAHCAMIVGFSGCGKTEYILDLLEGPYRGVFHYILILCPTVRDNKAYRSRHWLWSDRRIFIVDPGERLQDWLRYFYKMFRRRPTLYIIDDMSASKAIGKKKDQLSMLAFSGRHALQSVWILTQKYNAVCTDFREQLRWVALFQCKDRDTFDECLLENYSIPTKEDRDKVRKLLAETKHAKVVIKNDQPTEYRVLMPGEHI